MRKRSRKKKIENKYAPPVFEKHKISDLAKGWNLESAGIDPSCPEFCDVEEPV